MMAVPPPHCPATPPPGRLASLLPSFLAFLLFLALVALYLPFLRTMIADWDQNANYSHGYLIPFISGYMIYSIRNELKNIQIKPANAGLLLILLGLAQLLVAKIGSEYFLQRTSLIIVLFGIILFLYGAPMAKALWIPVAYLIFMIPIPAIIWNKIAFPMQLFASGVTETVIRFIGISIYRQGNVLHLAQTTLEVVDACSGLRSLVSMFALSSALAFISDLSPLRKWILFLSAAPIAVFVNVLRLTFTAVLASRIGEKAAQGFLHDFSGWLIFLLGLVMLMGIHFLLSKTAKLKTR
jgi:exosortase